MTIGWIIKHIRESMGISQDELGNMINMTQTHVSRIERGTTKPNEYFLTALYQMSGNFMLLVYLCGAQAAEALERMIPIDTNHIKFA